MVEKQKLTQAEKQAAKEARLLARKEQDAIRAAERKAEKERIRAQNREAWNNAQANEETKTRAIMIDNANKAIEAYKKRGRPTVMTESVQGEILDRLANGQSLASICALEHMPTPASVFEYIQKSPSFAESYARARNHLADLLFDQCLAIADDTSRDTLTNPETGEITANHAAIQRDKIRIDTRFRMAGKMSGKYADKPLIADGASVTVNSLTVNARDMPPDDRERLRALLLQAKERAMGQVIDG